MEAAGILDWILWFMVMVAADLTAARIEDYISRRRSPLKSLGMRPPSFILRRLIDLARRLGFRVHVSAS
jgi:hypothetical protein